MFAIESKSLTKHYSRGKIKALTEFDLQLEKGRIFSLLGPNGAGKTTLMKLLLSIALPTSGEGYILGRKISDPVSRMNIGYLSENHRFPGFLDIEQFLYYYGKMSKISGSVLKDRIPELIKLVRLEDKKKLKLKKFSKGMLQRIGTAQALINDPEIIFLDEPTDGIDPVGRIEIREILLSLKERGKTVFINSHLLSEVERMSDEIAILKDGILIKKGKTSDFLESTGKYMISVTKGSEKILFRILESKKISFSQENNSAKASISDESDLNEIIDIIRAEKVLITGVEQIRSSLEDYFIKVIR
jgi:ABC-2 type transport system ATP-binding protein